MPRASGIVEDYEEDAKSLPMKPSKLVRALENEVDDWIKNFDVEYYGEDYAYFYHVGCN